MPLRVFGLSISGIRKAMPRFERLTRSQELSARIPLPQYLTQPFLFLQGVDMELPDSYLRQRRGVNIYLQSLTGVLDSPRERA